MRCALTLALLVPGAGLAQDVPADITAMARCVALMDGYLELARAGDYIDTEADAILTEANLADWAAITAHPAAAPRVRVSTARFRRWTRQGRRPLRPAVR